MAVEDHPFVGVDRRCPACDTANAAIAAFCGGCGGPMDGAQSVGVRAEQRASGGSFEADSAAKARAEAQAAKAAERAEREAPAAAPAPSRGGRWLGIFVAMAVVCGLLGWMVFSKTEAIVSVSGHNWERVVEVEQFATISETAWKEAVPADARNTSCREEQRSTRQVPDGQTCTDVRNDNGDGTFSVSQDCETNYRDVPVYDMQCTFTADRWTQGRSERAQGSAITPAPAWPAVSLRPDPGLGAEREASRREKYTVRFVDPEARELTCELPEAKWAALAVGSRWLAPVGRFVDNIDCEALRAP